MAFNYQAVADQAFANRQSQANQAQWQQTLALVGQAVASYKQQQHQQKLDTLANSLMADQRASAPHLLDADGNAVSDPALTVTRDPDDPTPPDLGGVAGLKLRQMTGDDTLNRALKEARIKKLLAAGAAGGNLAARPLTPYQQAQLALGTRRQDFRESRAPVSNVPKPQFDSLGRLNTDISVATGGHGFNDFDTGSADAVPDGDDMIMSLPRRQGGHIVHTNDGVTDQTFSDPVRIGAGAYQQLLDRAKAIKAGHPSVLNQPAIDAAGTYGARLPAAAGGSAQAGAQGGGADDQALAWAQANPDDRRSKQILARLGMQ